MEKKSFPQFRERMFDDDDDEESKDGGNERREKVVCLSYKADR